MRIDYWQRESTRSPKIFQQGISIVVDESEAIQLIARLSAQLAKLRLSMENLGDIGSMISSDYTSLSIDLIPSMAHTQPGTDPPNED